MAINYMDRFLSSKSVRKTHLQILAAACLLLASKLREPSSYALSVDLLVVYTDNSIYKDDLIVSSCLLQNERVPKAPLLIINAHVCILCLFSL